MGVEGNGKIPERSKSRRTIHSGQIGKTWQQDTLMLEVSRMRRWKVRGLGGGEKSRCSLDRIMVSLKETDHAMREQNRGMLFKSFKIQEPGQRGAEEAREGARSQMVWSGVCSPAG